MRATRHARVASCRRPSPATLPPQELNRDLIRRVARGRSFLDVGCLWKVDGDYAFGAVAAGADRATGLDVSVATPAFLARNQAQGRPIRFVQGDINAADIVSTVGVHDVVFCSGVLYHVPHPLLTLERLHALCGEYLILSTPTFPEARAPQGAVFFPLLDERGRRHYNHRTPGREKVGLDSPFVPEWGYANYFWGFSPSCVAAMLTLTGFQILERFRWRRSATFLCVPTARPSCPNDPG